MTSVDKIYCLGDTLPAEYSPHLGQYCCLNGKYHLITPLAKGMDIDAYLVDGLPLVHWLAISSGESRENLKTISLCHWLGADIDIKGATQDLEGTEYPTALFVAALLAPDVTNVETLVGLGACCDVKNSSGQSLKNLIKERADKENTETFDDILSLIHHKTIAPDPKNQCVVQ